MGARCPWIIFGGREKEAGDKNGKAGRLIIMLQPSCLLNAQGYTAQERFFLSPTCGDHIFLAQSWVVRLAESIPFSFNTFERPSDL